VSVVVMITTFFSFLFVFRDHEHGDALFYQEKVSVHLLHQSRSLVAFVWWKLRDGRRRHQSLLEYGAASLVQSQDGPNRGWSRRQTPMRSMDGRLLSKLFFLIQCRR